MDKYTEYIKVNFPDTFERYQSGHGEGMWVLVEPATKKAYDEDVDGGVWVGILDNDSFYYPNLKHGCEVQFEMRGENRPVAIWEDFLSKIIEESGFDPVQNRLDIIKTITASN